MQKSKFEFWPVRITSSLAYLRQEKEIRSFREQSKRDRKIRSLFEKRDLLIVFLHNYYGYSILDLRIIFNISRSAIYTIIERGTHD